MVILDNCLAVAQKLNLQSILVRLLERFSPEFRERHIETRYPGDLVAVDTFFVGTLKGVGKVYLQTVLDTFSRYAWGLLHASKMPVTAVQTLNNAVLPFFDEHGITILSDNGREYCGRPDQHPYELFLQLEQIEHRPTKVRRPQSNGFIERLHRTLLGEHFRLRGREKFYESVAEMQVDRDACLAIYNTKRPHQGRGMYGMAPLRAFEKCLKLRPKTEPEAEPKEAA